MMEQNNVLIRVIDIYYNIYCTSKKNLHFHYVLNLTLTFIAANSFTRYLNTNGMDILVHSSALHDVQYGLACWIGILQ